MSQLTIAHVIDGLGSGGAEALLLTNLRALAGKSEQSFRHVVVTLLAEHSPLYGTEHVWADEIRALGIPLVHLGCRSRADLMSAIARLARLLKRERVDVVHTHLLWAGLVGRLAATLASARVVSSLHAPSYEPQVLAGYKDPRSKKHELMRRLEALSLRQADAIIAVGASVRESAFARLAAPPERMRLIYNPVDFAAADAQPAPSKAALLASLGAPASAPLLVNVARVAPQKNQRQLMHELTAVTEARLAILGAHTDAGYVREVHRAAAEAGVADRVHFLGVRKDVSAWLKACDAFVFPSTYEGLSVALIEAAGAGCACIASDIGPNREVLTHDVTGVLAPIDRPMAFGAALARVLGDAALRVRLGDAARREVRRRFAVETAVDQLSALYVGLANSKA